MRLIEFEKYPLRVVRKDEELFWVVKDIAIVMGFKTPHHASRGIDKTMIPLPTPGGIHSIATVDTSAMLTILTRGRRKASDEFKNWVNFEAIPQAAEMEGVEI